MSPTPPTAAPPIYCTTFCNRAHNVKTGRPIDHECYILPPAALQAERAGDMDRGKGPIVRGRKAKP
jgi:hypothetical protein